VTVKFGSEYPATPAACIRSGSARTRISSPRVARQPRSARASDAARQRFEAGPCADVTEHAAERQRAVVMAPIDTGAFTKTALAERRAVSKLVREARASIARLA
jgi:hypothetical protein